MEHQAEQELTASDGTVVKVRALKGRDLSTVGDSVARVLIHFGGAKGVDTATLVASAGSILIDSLNELIARCVDVPREKFEDFDLIDYVNLVDAFLSVNKIEEIAPLFFRLKEKVQKALPALKRQTS